MNQNKIISLLLGIGVLVIFLAIFLVSKSPDYLIISSVGLLGIVTGFFTEDKKINISINSIVALFGVNLIQWIILIYTFYYYPNYTKIVFILYIIPIISILFYNKNIQIQKNSILTDKIKSILLLTGIFIIISCLAGFIVYYSPLFLYGVTLGMMIFIYGFYHEDNKLKFSVNYIAAMSLILIVQWIINIIFWNKYTITDFTITFPISFFITVNLFVQFIMNDLKISNEKRENILIVFGITAFIAIFGAYFLFGYHNDQPTLLTSTGGSFENQWMSFNYPANWTINDYSTNKHSNIYIFDDKQNKIGSIADGDRNINDVYSDTKPYQTIIDERKALTNFYYYMNGDLDDASAVIYLTNSSTLYIDISSGETKSFYQIINSLKIKKTH